MTIKDKHYGSMIGTIIGMFLFLIPFSSPELIGQHYFTTGILLILGSLAYRFRKKQFLTGKKRFPLLEIIVAVLLFFHLSFGFSKAFEQPINFLLIPIWIIVAYLSLFFAKNKK
jgi:hypothetical protein